MFVTLNTSGYDAPDVTGIFDTEAAAELFFCGMLVDAGVADTEEEARAYIADDDCLWIAPVSEPSPTSLTRA